MAVATSTIIAASVVASIAGAGISAYSVYQEGQAQEDMAKYNAKVATNEAVNESAVAGQNAIRMREMNKRRISAIRNQMAGSGVLMSSGSSLDTIAAASSELELQTMDMFRESQLKQTAYQNQAKLSMWQGKQASQAATIGAIGTLLSGAGQAGSNAYGMSNSKPKAIS